MGWHSFWHKRSQFIDVSYWFGHLLIATLTPPAGWLMRTVGWTAAMTFIQKDIPTLSCTQWIITYSSLLLCSVAALLCPPPPIFKNMFCIYSPSICFTKKKRRSSQLYPKGLDLLLSHIQKLTTVIKCLFCNANAVGLEPSKLLTVSVQLHLYNTWFIQQCKKHFNVDLAHVPVWAFSYAVYTPHS